MKVRLHAWGWLLVLVPLVTAKQGYIFTCPKALLADQTAKAVLTLFDTTNSGIFKVSVVDSYNAKTLVEITQNVKTPSPSSGQIFKIDIPVPISDYTGGSFYIKVKGDLGSYHFEKSAPVAIYSRKNNTFIQTDKPIYKPGQLVRLRILTVDPLFRPISQVVSIWIENPSGMRMAQWLNEVIKDGMAQYEMKLPDIDNFGTWSIFVKCAQCQDTSYELTEKFDVEKYVLPKFEVEITSPSFVLASATNITWEICARYTYGKLVKGNVNIIASYEPYNYNPDQPIKKFTTDMKINGCVTFTCQEKKLGWIDNYSNTISLFAKVTEDGTNVDRNSTNTIYLTKDPINLQFTNQYRNWNFKPGMPYSAQVKVSNPDDSPRPNEPVQVCVFPKTQELNADDVKMACKNFTTDDSGISKFTIPPYSGDVVSLEVEVKAANFPTRKYKDGSTMYSQPTNVMTLKPWFSPSKRYIQINPLTDEVNPGSVQSFTVLMNGINKEVFYVNYLVMSKGGLVSQDSKKFAYSEIKSKLPVDGTYVAKPNAQSEVGIVRLPVKVTSDMYPVATITVISTRSDGEIVADSLDFKVKPNLKNKVKLEFSSKKELPGQSVTLKLNASPKSKCGVGAVDKSITLLSTSTTMTPKKVMDILSGGPSYLDGWFDPDETCIPQKTVGPPKVRPPWQPYTTNSDYADSLNAIQNGKMLFLTDLTLVTKPCSAPVDYPYYEGLPVPTPRPPPPVPHPPPPPSGPPPPLPPPGPPPPRPNDGESSSRDSQPDVNVRDFFPETWLWDIYFTNENGLAEVKSKLPDTITEWDASAVCLHPENGLGASENAKITTFQPFFVSATLPYSIIRGEHSPIVISIFNYYDQCLPVTHIIDPSTSFTLLNGASNQDVCICGGDTATLLFLFNPTVLGLVNITSRAYTNYKSNICGNKAVGDISASDGATNSLLVEPEGFLRTAAFSNFFCPAQSNGIFNVKYSLTIPENSVLDSAKGECFVTGDLMGPALRNIGDLIQMPTGCGEQNMLNFVPDIYIGQYLEDTGKLDDKTRQTLIEHITTGYQRELTYRHSDGSYSAFGESDASGSNWLTAFVVKGFSGAQKFIYVDQSHISSSVEWIKSTQISDNNTGCYPQVGTVLHTAMQGGSGSNLGSFATLTAYITISLLESGLSKNDGSIKFAISCLSRERNPTTYTLSLITYAVCLANDPQCSQRIETLMKLKKTKGEGNYYHYWDDDDSSDSDATRVETTSYVLLSLLTYQKDDFIGKSLPIVRWLTSSRNTNGGFYSTQDTVIALQALAKYSALFDKSPINIDVVINEEGGQTKSFHVDNSNKILVQTTQLQKIPTTVSIQGTGTGCSLVQCNMFYSVLTPPDFVALSHNISVVRGIQKSCKKASITSCMGFNYENRFSNMVVMELRLPSGFEPDMDSINSLKNNKGLYFKRVDYTGNMLALYFDKVGPTKICFSFNIEMAFDVQNMQPSTVRLFEYYQPENQITQGFKMDKCTIPDV